jgi:hypothetical protein
MGHVTWPAGALPEAVPAAVTAATGPDDALALERTSTLLSVSMSWGRRTGARLVSGDRRGFGLSVSGATVHVPVPFPGSDWTRRTVTCGIALQCAPSKDRLAHVPTHELSPRALQALILVEAEVALAWVHARWPGLIGELRRLLGDVRPADEGTDAATMLARALDLAGSRQAPRVHPVLGSLVRGTAGRGADGSRRWRYGRLPWSDRRRLSRRQHTVPVGGDGGDRDPNPPPPSRPEDESIEVRRDARVGIPYPEWNLWTERFLPGHVAVLERRHPQVAVHVRAEHVAFDRWFEEHTRREPRGGLEDGADLDVDRFVAYHTDLRLGGSPEPRVFRDLVPADRDVATALLLDGSASLGARQGGVFRLELACADALSRAMARARERHGVFLFSGDTRHRVDVRCLKDFDDPQQVLPGDLGLRVGGYTRLGAPIRHLTARLLAQPAERRLLLVIGDGMISDEGYEGRYAWADVAHALDEATEAGVTVHYIGIGPTRIDPLPEVFGPERSQRIAGPGDLPQVLAHVHRRLVTA